MASREAGSSAKCSKMANFFRRAGHSPPNRPPYPDAKGKKEKNARRVCGGFPVLVRFVFLHAVFGCAPGVSNYFVPTVWLDRQPGRGSVRKPHPKQGFWASMACRLVPGLAPLIQMEQDSRRALGSR